MNEPATSAFVFGPFRLDPGEATLTREGQTIPLTPKAFQLLLCLVENRGRLLKKEDLLAEVWPGTYVEEAVLSVNISSIRKALGDDPTSPTYIETVPRRGYRFVAEVTAHAQSTARPVAPLVAGPTESRLRPRLAIVPTVAAALTLAVVAGLLVGRVVGHGAPRVSSVAVLPLDNLSGDAGQEPFADATTEMLITDLGRIPALRVVSRQSILQYKASRRPLADIARELKADYIVEGTVGRDGEHVRVTAQLIDGATDRHVWARSYERDLGGAFSLQSDIAAAIAREIGVTLAPATAKGPSPREVPAEAYEAYLRGNYLLNEGHRVPAIAEFQKAIRVYPPFADAYSRIANSYFGGGFFGGMAPKDAWVPMRESAVKAIAINDGQADAHAALAMVKLHYDWDWPGAEHEFRRSLQLNPSDCDVRHLYAHYLLTVGRPADSMAEMDHAFEIDPVGRSAAT